MNTKKSLTYSVLSVFFLMSGCGGGGGGGGGDNGGGITAADLNLPFPDTVIADTGFIYAQGERHRVNVSCSGLVCTMRVLGESETVNLLSTDASIAEHIRVIGQYERNGVKIARFRGSYDDIRYDSLGAWGEFNEVSSGRGYTIEQGVRIDLALPVSTGIRNSENPITGSASWSGVMMGSKIGGSSLGHEVVGDANLRVDFSDSSLDVEFTDITRVNGGSERDMAWQSVPIRNGKFEHVGLFGQFYGPDHEEAGGVFQRDQIIGGFSVRRD